MAEITPALTPEEWAEFLRPKERVGIYNVTAGEGDPARLCHQAAAMNLHGQPFGFCAADLHALAYATHLVEAHDAAPDNLDAWHLRSLAARIAALLPPEDVNAHRS